MTTPTVQQLRDLLEEKGYTSEQAASIKGKDNLAKELRGIEEAAVDILDSLEEVSEDEDETNETPEYDEDGVFDEEGHLKQDVLLTKLTKTEQVNGHPTVNGLRRIINDYVGWISSNTSRVVQVPTPENQNRATVEVTVEIQFPSGFSTIVSGCADVWQDNTPRPFSKHPVATAESRAEGRAYRKALNLDVTTAEEMGDFTEEPSFEPIKDSQVTMIRNLCKRCDIDLDKFLAKHTLTEDTLSKASYHDGEIMCLQVSEYQSLNEIPEEIQKNGS